MKLVGRIPVEPLDDERMTNIERRIVAGAADAAASGRREPRFSLTFGFAATTVVVALGAGLVGWKMRGGTPADPIADSSTLHVHTDATATTIDIGDARITSDPSTQFDVTRPGGGVLISMTRGKVALEVGKRGNRAPLIVHAGDTEVEVVGTRFSVDFGDGSGPVDVRVTEGVVKVKRRDQEARVAAGEAWRTDQGKLALADAEKPARTPNEITIPIDMGKDIGLHDRIAQVPQSRIPTTVIAGSDAKPIEYPDYVPRPTLDPPAALRVDLKKAVRSQPIAAPLDLGVVGANQAVSKYRQMAAFGTQGAAVTAAEASLAFYSIAAVQHLKLGRDTDASQTLDAYFRRFRPDAKEYQAARWLQVRVHCYQKIDDGCRQAAFTYAHEYPSKQDGDAGYIADKLSTAAE